MERLELVRVVARPVVGDPVPADRELVEPQHVHDADRGDRHAEQVGPLLHHRADQQAAVGAAHDRQPAGRVLLAISHSAAAMKSSNTFCLRVWSRRVPRFAVLAAAAQVDAGIDDALLEQRDQGAETRRRRRR